MGAALGLGRSGYDLDDPVPVEITPGKTPHLRALPRVAGAEGPSGLGCQGVVFPFIGGNLPLVAANNDFKNPVLLKIGTHGGRINSALMGVRGTRWRTCQLVEVAVPDANIIESAD